MNRTADTAVFYSALSLKTKKEIGYLTTWCNSQETIKYLEIVEAYYKPKLKKGQKVLLVWDGASFHRSAELKEWLRIHKADEWLELMRFPPYCPTLNPQEHVWKSLRKMIAKLLYTWKFREVIDRACNILMTETFDYAFY